MTCALFSTTLLLSAPACAATVIGPGGKPIPRATAPTSVVREEPEADCEGPRQRKRIAFQLALQTPLADAVAWISSVVCKPFELPGTIFIENKMLIFDAPERGTPDEAYRLFLAALERVGLTVETAGQLERIIDIAAVSSRPADADPWVTVLLHLHDVSPEDRPRLFEPFDGPPCDCIVSAPDPDTVIVTDRRSRIEHLLHRPIGR